jgi:predicted O-methyltransferase YrrM
MINLYRLKDRIEEWLRYPQPTWFQKTLLGMYTDVIDTDFTAARLASEESARYILEHLRTAPNFATDYDLHDWVVRSQLSNLLDHGNIVEFGVATGRTLNHIARLMPHKTVHGFDSFQGLPEDWTSRMPRGFFARDNLPKVRSNCRLHVGWFDDTLPKWAKSHGDVPIQLLHIDSDLYSSAVTILKELSDLIVPNTVIIFDEYINYPGWQQDEFRAWQEFVQERNIKYQYIGYVSKHQKVAVRVL